MTKRTLEWMILAITIAAPVWAWLTFVVRTPQDFDAFFVVFAIATIGGATLQVIFIAYVRPRGSLRERLSFRAREASQRGDWIPLVAPTVVIGLTLLVLTPSGTPVDDYDSSLTLYPVIGLITLLTLLLTLVGAGAVFLLIVMPLGWLVASGLAPDERNSKRQAAHELTRPQLVIMALLILCAVGFAVSLASIDQEARGTRAERMWDTVVALFTATGDPVASALAWCFALALALIVVVHWRVEARLRKRDPDPTDSPDTGEDATR